MEVFLHHIYEFEKGIRNLILHTISEDILSNVKIKLNLKHIPYQIYKLKNGRYNIFFGDSSCVDVIRQIGKSNLSHYTIEEDFILGIMLGYDRKKQCERYIKFKNNKNIKAS